MPRTQPTITSDDINKLRRDIAHKKHEINLRHADTQRVQNQIDKEKLEVRAEKLRQELIKTQGEVEMFGPEAVLYLQLVGKMTQRQVPNSIVGGDVAEAMRSLPFSQVSELLTQLRRAADEQPRLDTDDSEETTDEKEK